MGFLDKHARTAATQIGCEVGAIVNSLVFDGDGEPLVVLVGGAARVDTDLVAATPGGRMGGEWASAAFVRQATGTAIGGVVPTGNPGRLLALVDVELEQYVQVWAAGGTPARGRGADPPLASDQTSGHRWVWTPGRIDAQGSVFGASHAA